MGPGQDVDAVDLMQSEPLDSATDVALDMNVKSGLTTRASSTS